MSQPNLIELNAADFVTVGTIGPPGKRTFFLQAAQETTVVSLVIEKEHAAALAITIRSMLEQLSQGETALEGEPTSADMGLIHPVEPLFRVGQLGLGYDETQDMLVIMAEELAGEEDQGSIVRIWGSRVLMAALADHAATIVAAGRPICPLCNEVIDSDDGHVCIKGNGHKRLYKTKS